MTGCDQARNVSSAALAAAGSTNLHAATSKQLYQFQG
jgi:hypothetical protein